MDTIHLLSTGPELTKDIADLIGQNLKGGEVIELISDVGGGKTTFTKGLARGMGSSETVRSPSFALEHEYKAKELTLYHLDFYRLSEPGIMKQMLEESLEDGKAIIVVEWSEIIKEVLPQKRLQVMIKSKTENERELFITYPDELDYLVKDLAS